MPDCSRLGLLILSTWSLWTQAWAGTGGPNQKEQVEAKPSKRGAGSQEKSFGRLDSLQQHLCIGLGPLPITGRRRRRLGA